MHKGRILLQDAQSDEWIEMESEYELIHTMQELVHMKEEYVKVQAA